MQNLPKTRWISLLAIIPAAAMGFMDQSILPVALPVIQKEFGSNSAALQWTVNSYLLTTAVFILLGGKLCDRIGSRNAYLYGLSIFAVFSALCSLSPNVEFLVAARALQGVGAAILFPAQTSLIATTFPPHTRGRATGLIVSCGSLFLILGPLIGGYLTEALSWRWIFWINLPIAAIGIVLAILLFPAKRGNKGKVDLLGFLYFACFCTFTTIFFMQAQDWGWLSKKVLICALLAIGSSVFLFKREKTAKHPFLDLALFKRPIYAAINVSISITQFVLMITVFRTIYLEEILGYTPGQTGLISSISSLPVLFLSPVGGFLSDKVSPKLPIVLGYGVLILSFFWLGFFSTPSLPSLFTAFLLFGMGIPLIFTPSYTAAMSAIPREKLGIAFGLVSSLRMFAATTGLSLIYLFVSIEKTIHLPKVGQRLAEIASFSAVHFTLGALMIVAFIATFFLHRRKSAHHLPDSPAEGWD